MIKHYGFIEPVIEAEHYVLGASAVPKTVLMKDCDWRKILAPQEEQSRKFETFNCTTFNTLRSLSRLVYLLTGEQVNFSDRFLGIVAGTLPPGNDPHTVCEAIRKYGVIPETMLSWTDDLQNVGEYYSFKGGNEKACYAAGALWLTRFKFLHEWVFKGDLDPSEKIKRMQEALQYSPLGVSVNAWREVDGIYVSNGETNNHWTEEAGKKDLESWIINDSYKDNSGSFEKNLEWLFDFQYCKRYSLELKPVQKRLSFWQWITGLFKR